MKKAGMVAIIAVAVVAVVLGIVFITKGANKETTYREAVAALAAGSPDKAVEGFRSLPEDYSISDFNPTAAEWLTEIETTYHYGFVGSWKNENMSFDIMREIDSFGIRFKYRKTTGGQIADGYLIQNESDDTVFELQSDVSEVYPDSIAGVCRLRFIDDNTMELYVNGELSQTFSK